MIHEHQLQRQADLEIEMSSLGAHRYRASVERSTEKGRVADTGPGVFLLKQAVEPMTVEINKFVAASIKGKPGKRSSAAVILQDLNAPTVAFLTTKACLNFVARPVSVMAAAYKIGKMIEDEARFEAFARQTPRLFKTITSRLDEKGATEQHKRRVLIYATGKYDIEWTAWGKNKTTHLGIALINMFIDATGILEIVKRPPLRGGSRHKKQYQLIPSDKVTQWIADQHIKGELLYPMYLPMLIPPTDWTGMQGGGYLTNASRPLELIKRPTKRCQELIKKADLSVVCEAINATQRTAWKINEPVLKVMQTAWENGLAIADLPEREDEPMPVKPTDIDENEEARKEWRAQARMIHDRIIKGRSNRVAFARLMQIADRFRDEATIYFPHQLDFRGRMYAVPVGLNPQGQDYSRSLLTFAQGKEIKDDVAAGWLMVHGANCYGADKVSLEDRVSWVNDNETEIIMSAKDPLGDGKFWMDADKPWAFLAFCFEYASFIREGYGYVSALPIAVDGTCNGLQHFSAMLRDPVGGKAVNLLNAETPEDIYQTVADVTIDHLKAVAAETGENRWIAETWLAFGIDRKITKRPVMVLPYGGTRYACLRYVEEVYNDKLGTNPPPFGSLDDTRLALCYLSNTVWTAISETVVSARVVMDWLQTLAHTSAKVGQSVEWLTPSGLPVHQGYTDVRQRRVKTTLQGSIVYFLNNEKTDKLDAKRQRTGVSPNFVHSMDAAALAITIGYAQDNGVSQFAMIHDSYGTVAADMHLLGACLRHAFVDMYKDADVLEDFRDGVTTNLFNVGLTAPPVPVKGNLDIEEVLQSDFFFS